MPFLGPNLAQKDFKIVNTQSPQSLLQDSVKNIEKLLPYMQRVIDGEEEGNQELGRRLLQTLNKIDFLREDQETLANQNDEAALYQQLATLVAE